MKKINMLIMVFFIVVLLSGCTTAEIITPEGAKKMLDTNPNVVLVDVRTEAEFRESRIPGAILVPLATLEAEASIKMADKKVTYIIYCRSGNRSNTALNILKDMGYTNLYDLGGIIYWPYETTSG